MNRFFIVLLFILFATTVFGQNTGRRGVVDASAEQQSNFPANTYAVIIGISNYKYIDPLKYADDDANLFMRFLMSPSGGKVPRSNILYMINDSAKYGDIKGRAYGWVRSRDVKPGDRFYFYFAGHGDAMNDKLQYFMAHDANPKDVNLMDCGAIGVWEIKYGFIEPLVVKKKAEVIFIVDACRSNELKGGAEGQKLFRNSIIQERTGEMMLIGSGKDQKAYEDKDYGKGHGLFTYYLIEGMIGKADEEGDNDGVVSFSDLKDYVPRKVRQETSKNKTKFPTVQEPEFCCNEFGTSLLSRVDKDELAKLKNKDEMRSILSISSIDLASNAGARSSNNQKSDSLIGSYYRSFNKALKDQKLTGPNSAEEFYSKMVRRSPDNPQTIEAKYTLAGEFINFGQSKINLYLSGKDMNPVNLLRNINSSSGETTSNTTETVGVDSVRKDRFVNNEYSGTLINEETERLERYILSKNKEAADMMEKAINILKNDEFIVRSLYPKLWFLRVRSYITEEDKKISYDSALNLSRKALANDNNAAYNYHIVGLMLESSYPDSGVYYYNQAISKAPNWTYPYNSMGWLYYRQKKLDSSVRYFAKTIALDSSFASGYANLGYVYYDLYEYNKSEAMYRKAIALEPANKSSYNSLGLVFHARNDEKNAEYYYKKSLQVDSNYVYAYHNLGILSLDHQRYALAERYLRLAIKKDSNFTKSYYYLGRLYEETKDSVNAERYYKLATRKNPNFADAFNDLGRLYYGQKKLDLAETNFRKAAEVDTNFASAIHNVGLVNHDKGNLKIAETYYLKAISKSATLGNPHYELGTIYESQKLWDKAGYQYEQSIEKNYNVVSALAGACAIYMSSKVDMVKANRVISRFVELYPDHERGYYYRSMYSAENNDFTKSIDFLETSLKKGLKNFRLYEIMGSYPQLRALPKYDELLKKYFPGKVVK